jgi:hypothetical protein
MTMVAPAHSISVHGIIYQFSSPPVRVLLFFAALMVAVIAVVKVVEGVSALNDPGRGGTISAPAVSATVSIAYELPLPSEIVFGPELRTYSQLAMSLSEQRAAMYWSMLLPAYSSLCAMTASASLLLSTYCDYTTSVRAGYRHAGAHYFAASATMVGVSTTASLCAGLGGWISFSVAVASSLAATLAVQPLSPSIPGAAVTSAIQVSLLLLNVVHVLPSYILLMPMAPMVVYMGAAFLTARRLPLISTCFSTAVALLVLGLLPELTSVPMMMIPELPTFASPQLHSIPYRSAQLQPSFACAAINSFSPTLASVVNCDHSLPQRLKASYGREGSYSEWMHDSGAGKTHISPLLLRLCRYTSLTPAFFGGIGGGSSMSPASGRVDMVQLDVDGRPYV